jgi:hypothetical protein
MGSINVPAESDLDRFPSCFWKETFVPCLGRVDELRGGESGTPTFKMDFRGFEDVVDERALGMSTWDLNSHE